MKMLKTLLVSVLFVAQVSAVPTSDDAKKARLAKSIRNLQFNLGLLKKKSQPQKTMISKIGNTIKNNKGKIALGVGLITLGVLAYKNPAVVVNSFNSVVGTAKNLLFGKKAQVVQSTTIAQPITSISNKLFEKAPVYSFCRKVLPNGVFSTTTYKEICLTAEEQNILEWKLSLGLMKQSLDYVNGVYAKIVG